MDLSETTAGMSGGIHAGHGLRGIPGIPGWQREALGEFIRHSTLCFAEEPATEAVGVFLLKPIGMLTPDIAAWAATYKPLQNVHADPTRFFEIDETELMHEVAAVMDAWEEFFIGGGTSMANMKLYNPILGIGHSHPGGSAAPSSADKDMFRILREGKVKLTSALSALGDKPLLNQESHWICAFGSFGQQTLVHLAGDGNRKASFTGDFLSAVQ